MHDPHSIEVLSSSVIEKIAAGEVVERPAAVIKELVENSIDAGATKIDISVEDAGFSIIRITDNGDGMSQPDLRKSMLRHATSKIRDADDLFAIGTFGFRGEALGSVAAVSRMSVVSACDESGEGYLLENEGGEQGNELLPHPHRRGTTVTVKDLFFNVPARKKFMKTRRGEHLAIVRMLEQLVIPFPSVHFTLRMDGKSIFDLPVVDRCIDRIAEITGTGYASSLIECKGIRENMEAVVYVSSPEKLQERPRFQSLYVNLRRINNDSVQYSIREAFSQYLGHNQRCAFFCFLTIDPSRIDVNVHPTKQLIKFDNEREIFSFVFSTVKEGIAGVMVGSGAFTAGEVPFTLESVAEESTPDHQSRQPDLFDRLRRNSSVGEPGSFMGYQDNRGTEDDNEEKPQTILAFPEGYRVEKEVDRANTTAVQLSGDAPEKMWDLIPCYQIHAMFILAPIKNGILLIDQHAAHERILYEQAMKDSEFRQTVQQLLFPVVVELSPAEKGIVDSGMEHFTRFGFEIADFGGKAVSISAIPAFLKDGSVESTLREMVRYLLEGRNPEDFSEPRKRFAAAFACGAAIKAGQKLSQEEMNALLNTLFATENPYTCPHGRPTLIRMSVDELTRRFLR
ncbi:MAG: DNA mismatch repair endonuclease MutL [Chitinispirillaceae bacterium]|nr:DNA mismatch repair endonuclease MutL [Chitinispirillaceae bacterium]